MNPVLKDWLQNLGCLLPLGFFGFCTAFIIHWVTTETGPARFIITWQAKFLEGQYSPKLTMAIFMVPTLLIAWLIAMSCRRVLKRLGVYDRPTTNAGFKRPNGST
ncbi:hypothetical protein [Leptothoe spongobia]|uniref:Uncharacterized protein n=1 Tax=Leptothoe spongobia TAU-MAC 1115 TaxID=1967444 RepID=A0A947DFN6_9CYAN|nr:hypothetical protein [Leptothoe spongobia]MBT9316021.1 hypothetical protein [Leptothoe spongobia TAU-MAC 1115]